MKFISLFVGVFWNRDQKRLRLLPRLALFILLVVLLFFSYAQCIVRFGLFSLAGNMVFSGLIEVGIAALAVFLAGWLFDRRKISAFGFHLNRGWLHSFAFGLLLGALLMAGIFLVEGAAGWIQISGFLGTNTLLSSFPTAAYFWSQFFQSMLYYLCAAAAEELLFRAYPLINLGEGFHNRKISRNTALWLAVILTSIAFGLAHLGNPHASWVAALNIFFAGIMLSLGLVYEGELALPIGLHFSWNFFQGVIFGFPISGTIAPANLIRLQQSGPQLWTGGAFGPEAGLLGLAATLIGCVAIFAFYRHKI
jgi:uncharacterized protein